MLQRQLTFIFCVYVNLVVLFCTYAHTQEFNDAIQTLPAYIIASKADLLNSTTCRKELQNFRNAIDQRIQWSFKVLDSSGIFKPGFLYGNNYWLGSRGQCLDIMSDMVPLLISRRKMLNNTALFRNPQTEFPPFQINYFVAHFRHNSTFQYYIKMHDEAVITLGLCLPASCSVNELNFILEGIFHDRSILIHDLYSADFQLIQVKNLQNDNKWLFSGTSCFICVCLGLSFLMTVIGTIYDIFVHQKDVKKNEVNKTDGIKNITNQIEMKANLFSHQGNKIGNVLICFSAYTNTKRIFNMKFDTGTIPAIYGLKVLNICLTIIHHSYYYTRDIIDNKIWLWIYFEKYYFLFYIMFILVDVFFFSSGCLVAYLYLREKMNEKLNKSIDYKEKLIELFMHIIKRFIRLTPAYMMALGILQLSSIWFDKTSQFYVFERSHETCSKYWWRNLLYINNFFDLDEMCMSWSWYLANDMQFYIIAVMLLILSITHFYVTVTILSTILISSSILSGYISYVNECLLTVDEFDRVVNILYISPWMRINSYIIGIISGYILIKLNNNLVLKREVIILCWCFAGACNIWVLFGFYNPLQERTNVLTTAIYVALYRIFWAISIAWVVIACSTKHGGIVNQLLSFKGWIPLSKLTYGAYLLNPIIIKLISLYSETSIHFEILPFIVTSVGYIIISFFCSYIFSLMMEIPCILLMQKFIHYSKHRMHKKIL